MKKILVLGTICAMAVVANGQAKKSAPAVKPKAPAAVTATMKNSIDSFSYAIGLSIANFYKEQGVKEINNAMVMQALNDVKNGKAKMDEAATNSCIVNYMQTVRSGKAAGNRKLGEEFLAANKSKPGVVTLPSGLQYSVIKEGTGPKPVATDKVKVHYEGKLLDGYIFDSSIQRGEPIEFNVDGVIPGWTEALQLMPVGSKWMLFIPADLAYGDNQAGPDIKPGSTLIFEVELLDIVKQ